MKPPRCSVCKRTTRSEGLEFKLVRFKLTPEQEAYNQRFKEKGFTGHPRGTLWFCLDHLERAQSLTQLPSHEAISIIKKEIADSDLENH